ncbi:MAG: hypothetical protein Q4C53_05650, partial [Clostridia bacterium]|nr:hypothetical protein [Clostridia bacterium]
MKRILSLLLAMLLLVPCTVFAEGGWKCPACGRENSKNFCPADGTKRPDPAWTCAKCGEKNTEAFCENCGTPRAGATAATAAPKPTA